LATTRQAFADDRGSSEFLRALLNGFACVHDQSRGTLQQNSVATEVAEGRGSRVFEGDGRARWRSSPAEVVGRWSKGASSS
jgi:hypothetical protein